MFTGLVETTGTVVSLTQNEKGIWRLTVDAPKFAGTPQIGDSIANNGCCLTVVAVVGTQLGFDVLDETLRKTSFSLLKPGCAVNLERSLLPTARMGGHFVTGHVDATGTVASLRQEGANYRLCVRPPKEFRKYLAYKCSVAVDGISLTVAALNDADGTFDVWLIPHTKRICGNARRASRSIWNLIFWQNTLNASRASRES